MRISDWSSDVCSSDLRLGDRRLVGVAEPGEQLRLRRRLHGEIGERGDADRRGHRARGQRALHRRLADELRQRSQAAAQAGGRSEERRVGKECGSTCRYRWAEDPEKQKPKKIPTQPTELTQTEA